MLNQQTCNMEETIVLSITAKEEGLEVRLSEGAYGNLALVGLLERIKLTLLETDTPEKTVINPDQKYDA